MKDEELILTNKGDLKRINNKEGNNEY